MPLPPWLVNCENKISLWCVLPAYATPHTPHPMLHAPRRQSIRTRRRANLTPVLPDNKEECKFIICLQWAKNAGKVQTNELHAMDGLEDTLCWQKCSWTVQRLHIPFTPCWNFMATGWNGASKKREMNVAPVAAATNPFWLDVSLSLTVCVCVRVRKICVPN